MPKKAFLFCVFLSVLFLFSCDIFGNKGDDDDGDDEKETETVVDETSAASLPNNIKALTAPGVFTISNTGKYSTDITLYAGTWNDTESKRIIDSTLTVKANVTDAKWDLTKVQGKNIWLVKASKLYYLTNNSIMILGSFEDSTDYTLAFISDYDGLGPDWMLSSSTNRTGFDWDTSRMGSYVPYGASSSLYDGNLVGVKVNLISSPEWTYTDGDGWFARKNTFTKYFDGLVKLKYTGNLPRYDVQVKMRIRNKNNTIRAFEYLNGICRPIEVSGRNYLDAVYESGDIIRFEYWDNIIDQGMNISDIQEVDLLVTASNPEKYTVPPTITLGTPILESENGYYEFTNTTESTISSITFTVFFKDSGNREYMSTYATIQTYDTATSKWIPFYYGDPPIGTGKNIRLLFSFPSISTFTETFTLVETPCVVNKSVVSISPSFVAEDTERKNADGNACIHFETIR